jgi:hypothetical protein
MANGTINGQWWRMAQAHSSRYFMPNKVRQINLWIIVKNEKEQNLNSFFAAILRSSAHLSTRCAFLQSLVNNGCIYPYVRELTTVVT